MIPSTFYQNKKAVTWTVGNLAAGEKGTATFKVLVQASAQRGEQLKSVADIVAATGLPDTDDAVFIVSDTPVWPSVATVIPVASEKLWMLLTALLIGLGMRRLSLGARRA